jgi:hypothetical protein
MRNHQPGRERVTFSLSLVEKLPVREIEQK